jgi:hypothetical protein
LKQSDPILSIPPDPDPDRISEVESGSLAVWKFELVHCFVLELDTAFCSLIYGRVLCEKLSKNSSVSGEYLTANPADWEPDPDPKKRRIRDPVQP